MRPLLLNFALAASGAEVGEVEQSALVNQGSSIVGFQCNWESDENGKGYWCDGWQNVDKTNDPKYKPSDVFDWVVRRGPSLSPATGPQIDHTTGSDQGQYLLVHGRDKKFLSRGEIASPQIDLSKFEEYCFSLWYLMYGRHSFSLYVYINVPTPRSDRELVFKASGSSSKNGYDWKYHHQTIKRPTDWDPSLSTGPHMVRLFIQGVRGLSYQSDIAIDDIALLPGPCPEEMPAMATKSPVSTTTATTTPKPTTTAMNQMMTREYNPFYKPTLKSCEVEVYGDQTVTDRYYTQTHICCGGTITNRMNGDKCCDGKQYFSRKQECCSGQVINKLNYSCCNGEIKELDPGNFCCGAETYPLADKTKRCCGGEIYDTTTKGCCNDSTFDIMTQTCCGTRVLDMTDSENICCGYGPTGRAFKVGGLDNCCNGNTYSKGDYDCCGGMYVFHKRYEKCLDPECVDDDCPELKEGEVMPETLTVKKKEAWRKVSHRASKYLFTYETGRRKRRSSVTNEEALAYYDLVRSYYIGKN